MAATLYRNAQGKRLPGASTIAKLISDPGGLIHWAWSVGIEGKSLDEERAKGADAGTLVHRMVQKAIHGEDPMTAIDGQPTELGEPALVGFGAFEEWRGQSRFELIVSELSLVSERYQYGGTLDAIARASGRLTLCDWKTGSLYPEHLLQTAGYVGLWEEHHDEKVESVTLCSFKRDSGAFAQVTLPRPLVDQAFEAFLHALALYQARATLRKML